LSPVLKLVCTNCLLGESFDPGLHARHYYHKLHPRATKSP
jgi:hypothetical protein